MKTLGKNKKTLRGFNYIEFEDRYGVKCSLQQSSNIEPCIWLGSDNANPRVLIPGRGWTPIEMPKDYLADTRMHLTKSHVKLLVKHLQNWLEYDTFQKPRKNKSLIK